MQAKNRPAPQGQEDAFFSASTLSLAEQLGQTLMRRGWMLGTAESCTGGLLAAAITSIAGSSTWFERGFITYSNAAKITDLKVCANTLHHFGAVSESVAVEMANGVLCAAPAVHIALSTTGIAGPSGAMPGKPLGTVCFGFAQRTPQDIMQCAFTQTLPGTRAQVRAAAVDYALRSALEYLNASV
jgi:nicotinamide-nucleotide amidase